MFDEADEASLAGAIVETISQPLLVLDADLKVKSANPAFRAQFQVSGEDTVDRRIYDLGNGQWNIAELRRLLEDVLNGGSRIDDYRIEHTFETIGERIMLLNAQRMRLSDGTDRILLAISDVTERERLLFELEGRREFAEKLIDSVREALLVLDWDLRVRSANQSLLRHVRGRSERDRGPLRL
jgi:PAS domain S-box-containing protein